MKKFKVKIEGITPYMQHRMDTIALEQWEKSRKLIIERPDVAREDAVRAEFHCYRNNTGQCFIPAEQLRQCIINAGAMIKSKVGNARKSMKNIVAAMFYIDPIEIPIPEYDKIDKRSAVNKNVKARIITIRPKWSKWNAQFLLSVDNDTITKETIEELLSYGGNYIGIGSIWPTNNGLFGRFKLADISEIKD